MPEPEVSGDFLERHVADAKLRLDFALQHLEQVNADHLSGDIPLAEPYAREYAIRAERSARDEYLRVLKIYADFVTRAKVVHNGALEQAKGVVAGNQPNLTRESEEP